MEDKTKTEDKEEDKSPAPKTSSLRSGITCVVITSLAAFATSMSSPLLHQYIQSEVKKEYFISTNGTDGETDVCHRNLTDNKTKLLDQIQKEASEKILYYSYAQNFPPLVINLVLGSYSDFLGRKMLFLFPLAGGFFSQLMTCVIMRWHLDMDLFYLSHCLSGLGGALGAFFLAVFSYIADTTPPTKTRTVVIAAMEGFLALSAALGMAASGFLKRYLGFFYSVLIALILTGIAILVVIFILTETVRKPTKRTWSPLSHLKNVFGFFFFQGTVKSRFIFILWLSVFFFLVLTQMGRGAVETIYQLDEPFCWSSVVIGIFAAAKIFIAMMFSILAIKICQKFIRDEITAILGATDLSISFLLECLAATNWEMYLVPVVGLISYVSGPIARSTLSLMTPPSKQGAIFSAFSTVDSICALASSTLYHTVYQASVSTVKGAVFLMMAGISAVNIVLLIAIIVISKNKTSVGTNEVTTTKM